MRPVKRILPQCELEVARDKGEFEVYVHYSINISTSKTMCCFLEVQAIDLITTCLLIDANKLIRAV